MAIFKQTPYEKRKAEDKRLADAAAAKAVATEAAAARAKADAQVKAETVEGAPYPTPYTAYEERLHALELLVALHGLKLTTMQEIPAAHDARLTALEVLVRAQASEIVTRATVMSKALPAKGK